MSKSHVNPCLRVYIILALQFPFFLNKNSIEYIDITIHSSKKKLLTQWEIKKENQLDYWMKIFLTQWETKEEKRAICLINWWAINEKLPNLIKWLRRKLTLYERYTDKKKFRSHNPLENKGDLKNAMLVPNLRAVWKTR